MLDDSSNDELTPLTKTEEEIITIYVKTMNDSKVFTVNVNRSNDVVSDLKENISNIFNASGKNLRLICSGILHI